MTAAASPSTPGALKALGDDLKVNIKVFIEGEEEMGSPSFIPFIEDHRDEFAVRRDHRGRFGQLVR